MHKRSHRQLASALLQNTNGFSARRYERAFLFGSYQPDCNPLSYLKGSVRAKAFGGHRYANSRRYIDSRITRLQRQEHWSVWQYYSLGKLTHYLADAFTFPHNETYTDTMLNHHRYERDLRRHLTEHLSCRPLPRTIPHQDPAKAIAALHHSYLSGAGCPQRDIWYILQATELLMDGCLPLQDRRCA